MQSENYICLKGPRRRSKAVRGYNVIKVSEKAYEYLNDILETSTEVSLARIASSIIEQSVEKNLIRFNSDQDEE